MQRIGERAGCVSQQRLAAYSTARGEHVRARTLLQPLGPLTGPVTGPLLAALPSLSSYPKQWRK